MAVNSDLKYRKGTLHAQHRRQLRLERRLVRRMCQQARWFYRTQKGA